MIHDELVQRRTRGDEHADRHSTPAARAADPLPRRSDGSGVPGENRNVQAADVDSQFQRIRGNDTAYSPFPQAAFNLPPLVRQITPSISDNDIIGYRPVFQRILQVPYEDFCDQPAIGENDRGNVALQKRRGNVLRFLDVRPAYAELPVDDRRIVEENMFLAFTRATLSNEFERLPGEFLR